MTDREIMQQALGALQTYGAHSANCEHLMLLTSLPPQRKPCSCGLVATIITMRDRLAQPEQEAPSPSVDAHNRMLRQQLEAEWVALQEIKRNYRSQPQQEHVIDCPRCGHCCPQTKGES